MIGFPIAIIWVIACPAIALVLLYRNIKKGPDNKVNQYLLILYQGLKPQRFYWEFVNTLRKVLLVIIIFFPDTIKVLFSAFVIFLTARIQISIKPYKDQDNNKIELLAMVAGLVTLLSTLIFSEEESISFLQIFFIIIVFITNSIFILEWIYKMVLCKNSQHPFFKLVSCFSIITNELQDSMIGCLTSI